MLGKLARLNGRWRHVMRNKAKVYKFAYCTGCPENKPPKSCPGKKNTHKYYKIDQTQQIRVFARRALKSIYPRWFCFRWVLFPDKLIGFVFLPDTLYVQKALAKNDMRATMGMDLREPYAESSVFFDTVLVGAGAEYVNL